MGQMQSDLCPTGLLHLRMPQALADRLRETVRLSRHIERRIARLLLGQQGLRAPLHAGARDRQLGELGISSTGHGDGCRYFALGVLPVSRRPVMATDVDLSLSVRCPSRAWSNDQLLVVPSMVSVCMHT